MLEKGLPRFDARSHLLFVIYYVLFFSFSSFFFVLHVEYLNKSLVFKTRKAEYKPSRTNGKGKLAKERRFVFPSRLSFTKARFGTNNSKKGHQLPCLKDVNYLHTLIRHLVHRLSARPHSSVERNRYLPHLLTPASASLADQVHDKVVVPLGSQLGLRMID